MGKLKRFTIEIFENQTLIYYPGQSVAGTVKVELSETKTFRGLSITICGESVVKWEETRSEGSGSNSTTTTDTYTNHERYFKERIILYGSGPETSGNNVHLPEGFHQFPFHFVLPQNIPNSYKAAYGSVDYSLKAVIDKAWAFDDEFALPFEIVNVLNLNNFPDAQMPVQSGATKHFCCWCCKSGPLSAMVRLDRKCYAPGQHIPISAEISNLTDRNIHKTKASIEMHITFHATSKSRTCTSKIARLERGPIKQGESDIWNGELLEIPPTPPSNLEYCSIIDIEYKVKFSACCHGAKDLVIPLDIIIGTFNGNVYTPFH